MNILDLYNDFGVPFQTEGHKHCRPGWVNTECPFCAGNPGLHLGYSINQDYFRCWRCGWKAKTQVIAKLLNVNENQAREIIREYKGHVKPKAAKSKSILNKHFKFPTNTLPLQQRHFPYLEKRGFDPALLAIEWNLMSTSPLSSLDKIDYRNRILIPIYWEQEVISFQARAANNQSKIKYKACPKEREAVPHQEVLYGKLGMGIQPTRTAICVEGVTDVWRLQPFTAASVVGVFGIEFSPKQTRLLSRLFDRVVVLFDDDKQAVQQAKKLVAELRFRGTEANEAIVKGDPGGLSWSEAEWLIKQIL